MTNISIKKKKTRLDHVYNYKGDIRSKDDLKIALVEMLIDMNVLFRTKKPGKINKSKWFNADERWWLLHLIPVIDKYVDGIIGPLSLGNSLLDALWNRRIKQQRRRWGV